MISAAIDALPPPAVDDLPTLREWHARQRSAPPEVRSLLDSLSEAAVSEAERLEAGRRAALAASEAAFESALADLLQAEGAGWLAQYRVERPAWAVLMPFDPLRGHWLAEYDPRAVGLHPVRVHLLTDGPAAKWWPAVCPWIVTAPDRTSAHRTIADATKAAARYAGTPF